MLDEPRTSQPPPMTLDALLALAVALNRKIRRAIRARKYPVTPPARPAPHSEQV